MCIIYMYNIYIHTYIHTRGMESKLTNNPDISDSNDAGTRKQTDLIIGWNILRFLREIRAEILQR